MNDEWNTERTDLRSRVIGALLGLACGDALGAPAEFHDQNYIRAKWGRLTEMTGGGPWQPGEWTDDTAMALAVAEGILAAPDDPVTAVGERFMVWYRSSPKDVGNTISSVLSSFRGDWITASRHSPAARSGKAAGNGSLMRTLPVALAYPETEEMLRQSARISEMTHWDPQAEFCCMAYNLWIQRLLAGQNRHSAWKDALQDAKVRSASMPPTEETPGSQNLPDQLLRRLENLESLTYEQLQPTGYAGYVLDCLEAAVWCVLNADSFEVAMVLAVNLGGETDTIAAVAGGAAGAYWRLEFIPPRWLNALHQKDRLERTAEELLKFRLSYSDDSGNAGPPAEHPSVHLLKRLFAEQKIRLQESPFLGYSPPPLPEDLSWDRVEGMLLGHAIGDSLGNTTESQLPQHRRAIQGIIRDYLPNHYAGGGAVGVPSDDTQMAFWTLDQYNHDKGFNPQNLAQRFATEQIFGIGGTVKKFRENWKRNPDWEEAGVTHEATGNGAIMRITPLLVPHLRRPSPALWAEIALAGMLTHNDPASTGSCIAYGHLLWETLRLNGKTPEPTWWLETFCETLKQLEGDTRYPTKSSHFAYAGPLWKFTHERIHSALERKLTVLEACNEWYSGAYLMETVPSLLYILCRHADDPEEALVRAVNDTKDNDSVGALVGAAVGALHSKEGLPQRWRNGLTGRTGANDDGRIFEIIAEAKGLWWVHSSS